MKRTIVIAGILLSSCSSPTSGSSVVAATATPAPSLVPSAVSATADQAAVARRSITLALQQIRNGRGVQLSGDSYIDADGADVPAHLTGQIAPDGAMDLQISVTFGQGTDVFEVRSIAGHEYSWDPSSKTWSTATLGEPAAGGISTVNPLFMDYSDRVGAATIRVAPDDMVNGSATSVYEVTLTSTDQNDQVTSRLWLAKDTGALVQEGVTVSSQVELPGGLGFNGNFLIQLLPADGPVSVSPPAGT